MRISDWSSDVCSSDLLQPDAQRQPAETRSDDDRAAHRARPGMAVIARPIGTGGLPVRMRIWSPMVERSAWNRPTIARALDRIAHTWKRPRRARPRARGDGDLRRPSPAARTGATRTEERR